MFAVLRSKKKISHAHVVYDIEKKQIHNTKSYLNELVNFVQQMFKSHREPVCESFSSCGTSRQ